MAWDWKETARLARSKVADSRHGGKEAALSEVGGSIDPNTVRRAVAAYGFLDSLSSSHPDDYEILKDSPFVVVEAIARWWSYDRVGAAAAAKDWKSGKLTARGLIALMRESRNPGVSGAAAKALSQSSKDRVAPLVREAIERELNVTLSAMADKVSRHAPRVDQGFDYTDAAASKRTVGVMIVGPYQNRSIYAKRMQEWIMRALGLSFFYDRVFVVVPEAEAASAYSRWLNGTIKDLASRLSRPAADMAAASASRVSILAISLAEEE